MNYQETGNKVPISVQELLNYIHQQLLNFDNFMKEMLNISSSNLSRLYLEIGWKLTMLESFKDFIKKRNSLGLKSFSFYAQ